MTIPSDPDVRVFYQSARQRFDDASFLLEVERTTGAVYLAGYGVECVLKALVLSMTPKRQRKDVLASFRGSKAHEYEWLKMKYLEKQGAALPPVVVKNLAFVNGWSTDLRYKAGSVPYRQARSFLSVVKQIIEWADGRL